MMNTIERSISCEISIDRTIDEVWGAWTTEEGIRSFFAPACNIEIKPKGAYEILFDLGAAQGSQGGEGMIILAVQEPEMLSFTWNAPPHLKNVRGHMTHVTVRLEEIGPRKTKVSLIHDGWGSGEEWDQAFEYFQIAWNDVVLKRLDYYFESGPVDWNNPPDLT